MVIAILEEHGFLDGGSDGLRSRCLPSEINIAMRQTFINLIHMILSSDNTLVH
jgi:hypothetical protein